MFVTLNSASSTTDVIVKSGISSDLNRTGSDNDFVSEGIGFGITVGVITDTGLTGQYGSNGMYFWGGAASTIFWIDPKEELVAVAMTQLLTSPWPLRETFSALVYQSIDD